MRTRLAATLLCLACLCAVGCGRDHAAGATAAPVLVLAAASTADAVREVADAFEREFPDLKVEVSAAGSNVLAKQILAGAPADVFLSASAEWAEAVEKAGLAVESRPLLTNELVIVKRRGSAAGITFPIQLGGSTAYRVALAGESVPAGRYAEQSLRAAGIYERLVSSDRLARGEDVRQALFYVETGEAEAGLIYATDAAASAKVEVVYTFPADSHELIVYPLVVLKTDNTGSARDAARALSAFMSSSRAHDIFRRRGFSLAAGEK